MRISKKLLIGIAVKRSVNHGKVRMLAAYFELYGWITDKSSVTDTLHIIWQINL